MRAEVVPWWEQAQANLATARVNAAAGIPYAASWFAQQAVELGPKALYIEQHGVLAPRTHNLVFLGGQVGASPAVAADLTALNPTFDLVRCPAPQSAVPPVRLIDQATADQDIEAAERVLTWIGTQLP